MPYPEENNQCSACGGEEGCCCAITINPEPINCSQFNIFHYCKPLNETCPYEDRPLLVCLGGMVGFPLHFGSGFVLYTGKNIVEAFKRSAFQGIMQTGIAAGGVVAGWFAGGGAVEALTMTTSFIIPPEISFPVAQGWISLMGAAGAVFMSNFVRCGASPSQLGFFSQSTAARRGSIVIKDNESPSLSYDAPRYR